MRTTIITLVAALGLMATASAGAQEGTGTVTVIHGVPGLTVDVYVNGDATLTGFEPGTITDPLQLPPGDYELAVREAGSAPDSDPAISGSATLEAGQNVSIVAHLDAGGQPTLTVFANDTSQIEAGQSRVTVRHTAAAPAVDILAGGEPLISGLENPNEETATVPAGSYPVAVAAAGTTDPVIGPTDLALEAGTAYAVYATGSLEAGNLDLLVQTWDGLGAAPSGVAAGTDGLAASGLPAWVAVLMAFGAVLVLGSTVAVARGRRW